MEIKDAMADDASLLLDEGPPYSKDYWDLVLEQLFQRKLFKVGMAVLALLYGLAIFAPQIGNDRPYKLVAIDYTEYARATRAIGTLSTGALNRLRSVDGEESLEGAVLAGREVQAVSTRLDTMRLYLHPGEYGELD